MTRALKTCAPLCVLALLMVSCAAKNKPAFKPHDTVKDATIVLTDDGKGGCDIAATERHEVYTGEQVFWTVANLCSAPHDVEVGAFTAKEAKHDCTADGDGARLFERGQNKFGHKGLAYKATQEFHDKVKADAAAGEYKYCVLVDGNKYVKDPYIIIRTGG